MPTSKALEMGIRISCVKMGMNLHKINDSSDA